MKYELELTLVTERGELVVPLIFETEENPYAAVRDMLDAHNRKCLIGVASPVSDFNFDNGVVSITGVVDWTLLPRSKTNITVRAVT